jgi:hypothetical protein
MISDVTISVIRLILAAVVLSGAYFLPDRRWSRADINLLFTAFIAAYTFQYWALGPYSYVDIGDPMAINTFHWMTHTFTGGAFSHDPAGGTNVYGLYGKGTEFVSLELSLLRVFPVWAASAMVKIYVTGTGLIGAYLLLRRTYRAERWIAAVFALFFVTMVGNGSAEILQGVGFAAAPLLVWLFVSRSVTASARQYWSAVIVASVVYAMSSAVWATMLPTLFVIVLAAVLIECDWRRVLVACFILGSVEILNWMDAIWALAHLAPTSIRGSIVTFNATMSAVPGMMVPVAVGQRWELALALLAIALLLCARRQLAARCLLVMGASLGVGPVLRTLPFSAINLRILESYDWTYLNASFTTASVVIIFLGATELIRTYPQVHRTLIAALLAISAAGSDTVEKQVSSAVATLGFGGAATASSVPNLVNPQWLGHHSFATRTVTVPFRLNAGQVLGYGIPTLDGYYAMMPRDHGLFWKYALTLKGEVQLDRGHTELIRDFSVIDFYCCDSYHLGTYVSIDMLRLANVGFVLSYLPLDDPQLTLIDGPAHGAIPARSTWTAKARLADYIHRIFQPGAVFVYAITDPMPPAYAAQKIEVVDDTASPQDFYQRVRDVAVHRVAVLHAGDSGDVPRDMGARQVDRTDVVRDGYDVILHPTGGPALMIINTPFTPFWHATDGAGQALPVLAVNGIQVGVVVGAATEIIHLRYEFTPPSGQLRRWLAG